MGRFPSGILRRFGGFVRRRWLVLTGAFLVAVLAGLAAFGWYFSTAVLTPGVREEPQTVRVMAVGERTVTLARSSFSLQPGSYRLVWGEEGDQKSTVVGEIVSRSDDAVRRRLPDRPRWLRPGIEPAVDFLYRGTPESALGIPYREVEVRGELGGMPAWWIGGTSETWVISVHGRGADRQEVLRLLPALHGREYPVLAVTYRNDPDAPKSPDGSYHYGLTEWRDIDAAVSFALDHGARSVVLHGDSMGGGIVAQYALRPELRPEVVGLVLDAAVLDLSDVLAFGMRQHGLPVPSLLLRVGRRAVTWRGGLDFGDLDVVARADELDIPVLLFHGTADTGVPISSSEALAEARPDLVTLVRVPRAEHVHAWTADRPRYERALLTFLRDASTASAKGGGVASKK